MSAYLYRMRRDVSVVFFTLLMYLCTLEEFSLLC